MTLRSIATVLCCGVIAWACPAADALSLLGTGMPFEQATNQTSPLPRILPISEFDFVDEEGVYSRVLFRAGTAELLDGEARKLDKQARMLKRFPCVSVDVQGWTDWTEVPTELASMGLGYTRAMTVLFHLVDKGISSNRIYPTTFGWHMTPKGFHRKYHMAETSFRFWQDCDREPQNP